MQKVEKVVSFMYMNKKQSGYDSIIFDTGKYLCTVFVELVISSFLLNLLF